MYVSINFFFFCYSFPNILYFHCSWNVQLQGLRADYKWDHKQGNVPYNQKQKLRRNTFEILDSEMFACPKKIV